MTKPLIAHLHPVSLQHWQENHMEHLRYKYKLLPHDIVIDLGAYNGEFAEEIHKQHGCNVICVEPTDGIQRLKGKTWVTIIEKAAGIKEGVQRFGGQFYYTSLFEDNEDYGFRDFPTFDVNDIINRQIALLKMNVEGAEYELMNHIIDSGRHALIDHFQVQFHLVDQYSEKNWKEIAKKLNQTHEIAWRMPFCWESWKRRSY